MTDTSSVDHWIQKATKESDPFDKYISYFIAHNMLCSLVALHDNPKVDLMSGDADRAFGVARIIRDKKNFVDQIKEELADYVGRIPVESEEFWKGVAISKELNLAINQDSPERIIEYMLKWLYKVRCNMFHGAKEYNMAKWGPVLDSGNALLGRAVSLLLIEGEAYLT